MWIMNGIALFVAGCLLCGIVGADTEILCNRPLPSFMLRGFQPGFVHVGRSIGQRNRLPTGEAAVICPRKTAALGARRLRASSNGPESVGGAAQKYLSRIPSHLQGIAIRNVNLQTRDYVQPSKTKEEIVDQEAERIRKELDGDEDDDELLSMMKEFDPTMDLLDPDTISRGDLHNFDGDIDDAMLLRDLRSKMDPSDFYKIFGPGIGDLL
uniref:Uncharacterized protein n=1 Tax=Cryptomonas curvata TaxID=233186 RepID=A0A7S0QHY8_9CRYP